MEMVEETLTKKQKQMLAMEDYLDLVDGHKNFEDLTVRQLNQVLWSPLEIIFLNLSSSFWTFVIFG